MTRNPVLVLSREDCRSLLRLLAALGVEWSVTTIRAYYEHDHAGADVLAELSRAASSSTRCCDEHCEGHEGE